MPSENIAVLGAGAFGGWTALSLLRRGAGVTLVDPWGPGNARASSGGESRVIRTVYGDSAIYSRWAVRASEIWRESDAAWETGLYAPMPVLWLCGGDDRYVRKALPHLDALGVRAVPLELSDLRTRFPQVDTIDVESAYLEASAGALFARKACLAVVDAFVREGGTYRVGAAEPPVIEGGAVRRMGLSDGTSLEADVFVFACGPWLRTLFAKELGSLLRVSRQEVYYFGTPRNDSSFDAGQMPIWVDIGAGYYGLPALDGRGFKVAADQRGEIFDPTRGDRQATKLGVEAARAFVAKRFPRLADAPLLEARVCQYTSTPDNHLLIDTHPAASNLWLVGGGSGHGFKLGPALGEQVAAYVLDGTSPEACFSIDRPGWDEEQRPVEAPGWA